VLYALDRRELLLEQLDLGKHLPELALALLDRLLVLGRLGLEILPRVVPVVTI